MGHERRDIVGRGGSLGVEPKVRVDAPSEHVLNERTRSHEVVGRDQDRRVVLFWRMKGCGGRRRKRRLDGGLRRFLPL